MATTTLDFIAASGYTLTAKLFDASTNALASGAAASYSVTEDTVIGDGQSLYSISVTEAVAVTYARLHLLSGTDYFGHRLYNNIQDLAQTYHAGMPYTTSTVVSPTPAASGALQVNYAWTFEDLMDHLLDVFDLTRTNNRRGYRQCFKASILALRELIDVERWLYLERSLTFKTVANYNTGTIQYDHTGGTNERELTLTTGTWPTWAGFGRVTISDVEYEVDTRVSDTVVTLAEHNNPGADVAAGTSYNLYRSEYPFPTPVKKVNEFIDVESNVSLPLSLGNESFARTEYYGGPGYPREISIRGSNDYYGGVSFFFAPPPDAARTYSVLYQALPRELVIERYATGTVTTSGTTVTLSGGTFPVSCLGSVIRFGTDADSTVPTNVWGSTEEVNNPFTAQRVITKRTSGTEVEINEALTADLASATGYTVSDPLDIDKASMLTALLRMAEMEVVRHLDEESKVVAGYEARARRALLAAREQNHKTMDMERQHTRFDRFAYTNITTDSG